MISIAAVALWRRRDQIPDADWPFTLDVDTRLSAVPADARAAYGDQSIRHGLVEKIILVGLISIIFSNLVPDLETTNIAIIAAVAYVITVNAVVSHWLARRGTHWRSLVQEFFVMAIINLAIGFVGVWFLPAQVDHFVLASPLFFTFLLTLIVTMYDRYRPIHDTRRMLAGSPQSDGSAPGAAIDSIPIQQ